MHLTRSFNENLDDVFKSENCWKLHFDVVGRLQTQKGDMKFKLEILKSWQLINKWRLKKVHFSLWYMINTDHKCFIVVDVLHTFCLS
jgi:mRNA-degrading endonuclease RelE of RelBE toxin-antitoxin system